MDGDALKVRGKWKRKPGQMIAVKGDFSFIYKVWMLPKDNTYMDYFCKVKIKAK